MCKILRDKNKSILARLSFILGLISIINLVGIFFDTFRLLQENFIFAFWVLFFGYPIAFFAILFGLASFLQMRLNNLGGKKLAIIGIILGALTFIIVIGISYFS